MFSFGFVAVGSFSMNWVTGPTQKSPTWRTRVYLFIWTLPFDLSGFGDPINSIALRINVATSCTTKPQKILN